MPTKEREQVIAHLGLSISALLLKLMSSRILRS
ncbi:hypothetical protein QT352_06720 [Escherichia coli]|nr:hypothetical protein [Escherichia coli]